MARNGEYVTAYVTLKEFLRQLKHRTRRLAVRRETDLSLRPAGLEGKAARRPFTGGVYEYDMLV